MDAAKSVVAGIDFGSDSVRVLVLDTQTNEELGIAACEYPRWMKGMYCNPSKNIFRQHPQDYIDALESCFTQLSRTVDLSRVGALAVDATGSTPAPVDSAGIPLALHEEFADNPNAMFWMWKDRSSRIEAEEITEALRKGGPDYTSLQGTYNSEWWWAKILNAVRHDESIRQASASWLEHSDWIPNLLVGTKSIGMFSRNSCAAGHKVLYNQRLGGMIAVDRLISIDPYFARIADTFRLPPVNAGGIVGTISNEWAARLGLSVEAIVGMGSLDAHAGGVGAGICEGRLVKVIGTSTVDLFLTSYDQLANRQTHDACGLAENSIVPGYLGGEAGQAAFGDLFAWYKRILMWPLTGGTTPSSDFDESDIDGASDATELAVRLGSSLLARLDGAAQERGLAAADGITALDWINGRRNPDLDEAATAALIGLRIGHDAVDVYAALAKSAVLGSKAIFESLRTVGISLDEVVLVGGIARKSPYICQLIADALGVPVMVLKEKEACARGASIFASVASGVFSSVPDAQKCLVPVFSPDYLPRVDFVSRLNADYLNYQSAAACLEDLVLTVTSSGQPNRRDSDDGFLSKDGS